MAGRWCWAHKNFAVAVGFDAALNFRENGIGEDLVPAAQVERLMRLLGWKIDGQRGHA